MSLGKLRRVALVCLPKRVIVKVATWSDAGSDRPDISLRSMVGDQCRPSIAAQNASRAMKLAAESLGDAARKTKANPGSLER